MTIAPYQFQLRGLTMGAGTPYEYDEDGPGGLGLPKLRTSDDDKPENHGAYPGRDYMDTKPITLPFNVLADSASELEDLLVELGAAWAPVVAAESIPLTLRFAGARAYVAYGKPRRFAVTAKHLRAGVATVVAQFEALDPRLYDLELSQRATGPSLRSGGLELPHGFPHGFGSASPGRIVAVNGGNLETSPLAIVTVLEDAITGLTISNVTTGQTFELFGLSTVAAGDLLTIDFGARSVQQGLSSRLDTVKRPTSRWITLPPGENLVLFRITGSGTAELALSWRDAYLI